MIETECENEAWDDAEGFGAPRAPRGTSLIRALEKLVAALEENARLRAEVVELEKRLDRAKGEVCYWRDVALSPRGVGDAEGGSR